MSARNGRKTQEDNFTHRRRRKDLYRILKETKIYVHGTLHTTKTKLKKKLQRLIFVTVKSTVKTQLQKSTEF